MWNFGDIGKQTILRSWLAEMLDNDSFRGLGETFEAEPSWWLAKLVMPALMLEKRPYRCGQVCFQYAENFECPIWALLVWYEIGPQRPFPYQQWRVIVLVWAPRWKKSDFKNLPDFLECAVKSMVAGAVSVFSNLDQKTILATTSTRDRRWVLGRFWRTPTNETTPYET